MKLLLKPDRKKLLCVLLCTVLVISAVGCKKESETSSSVGGSSVPSGSSEPGTSSDNADSSQDSTNSSSDSFVSDNRMVYTPSDSNVDSDYYDDGYADVAQEEKPYVAPAPDKKREPITVTQIVKKDGKSYVEYLGKPYLQYGVQITYGRTEGMTEKMKEEFFQKSVELGFETVIVAVRWNELEPEEGKYNLYELSLLLKFAEKYKVNLELLWFGDNVCGSTIYSPDYVRNDLKRFPMLDNFPDYRNKEWLRVEKAALTQMMNYIYDNDVNRRVTAVQILNEPNFGTIYESEQKEAYLNALDELGLTVKNSAYRVVTRVNLVINNTFLTAECKHQGDVLNLKGIDMVGQDVYTEAIEEYRAYAERFTTGDMAENVGHFAEGPGNMHVYPKQVLTAFMFNSGYDVYELKCYGATDSDTGIFRVGTVDAWETRDGTKRTQYRWTRGEYVAESVTADIVNLNRMINGIREQIATCPMNQFSMIFRQQTNKLCGNSITFLTAEQRVANRVGAVFLAADGYYYFFTPAGTGTYRFEDKTISGAASVGSFVNGKWKETETVKITNGNEIKVQTGKVYRISSDEIK